MDGWMGGFEDRRMDGQTDGWTDGRWIGWLNDRSIGCFIQSIWLVDRWVVGG